MTIDTVFKNGKIMGGRGICFSALAIDAGKIVSIGNESNMPKADSVIDLDGKLAVPGIIDAHVHIFDPDFNRETFETGSRAAAVGGVTTFLEMPTGGKHKTTTTEGFRWKKAIGEVESIVDFGLYGGEIIEEQDVLAISDLSKEGAVGFKITFGGGPTTVKNDGVIMDAFQRISEAGSIASIHAENHQLYLFFKDKIITSGRKDAATYSESRPNIVEAEAISRAIWFSRYAGNRIHIAHMSTKEGVELVKAAKAGGQKITVEVCPHHLLLTKKDYQDLGHYIVVNPPMRSEEDAAALWAGLADGTVDILATDHCAFPKQEKDVGARNIWETPPGIPNLETFISLLLSEGVNQGRISVERFIEVTSETPAKIFGLYPHKGALQLGSDADLTVIDLEKEGRIGSEQLKCVGDYTPFEGRRVKGIPILTVLRGQIVAQEGEVTAKKGYGRFIKANL